MTPAPVDQPWDLETALTPFHADRLELDRAWTDLRESLVEPVLAYLDRFVTWITWLIKV